jgi:hypothetical protein
MILSLIWWVALLEQITLLFESEFAYLFRQKIGDGVIMLMVESVFQKITVLVLPVWKNPSGQAGIVRMKSFIIGKGKGIT